MPDFDKNLNPILLNTDNPLKQLDNPATPIPNIGTGGRTDLSGRNIDPIFGTGLVKSSLLPTVSAGELYANRRYKTYEAGIVDIEDQKANAQSNWDKAANGILKGLNLAATTVAGGFGMLYGAAKSPFSGRLADIWDNDIMRDLDKWNNEVDQTYLPNYYTNQEKNAAWYSTDNWFTANFLFDKLVKNSGFAVGAMVSGNILNAGLLKAGAFLGEALLPAAAMESSQAFKLFSPLLRNTARAFSNAKNIEAAAVLEKEISSIADLTARSSKLAEIAAETSKFANIANKGRRTAIAVYSSAGEASFEALQTATEFRNNLINEYKSKHGGVEPVGAELDKINSISDSVGKTSFFGNIALLSATEYVQLPYLLGSSYKNTKNAANALAGSVDDVVLREGKYVAQTATTRFGKMYNKITGIGKYVFDPKEAGQEVGQYALQIGTQNYFDKAYHGKDAQAWTDGFLYGFVGRDEKGKGVGAFTSKEGMESLLLGGITGGLMQIKGNIQETAAKRSNTDQFLSALNGAPTFKAAFKDKLSSINRSVALQQEEQAAIVKGDELEARDLRKDMMHNYLSSRIKYGRFDMVMEDIADLRREGSTEPGLASLKEQGIANVNDTVESYLKRLSNFEKNAKDTNTLYESTNLRYSGLVDKDGKKIYSPEIIDKMVYAAAKVADYDVRIPQVSDTLVSSGVDVLSMMKDVLEGKSDKLNEAIETVNALDIPEKEGLITAVKDVAEMSLRRKLFLDEYNDIKNNPESYKSIPENEDLDESPTEDGEVKKTIKIKTKDGEEELEIGTEYFLGKVTELSKEGKEVYRFPKLTILGENEDGTIKIKDNKGVRNVDKSVLLDYKLGKVSDTLTNKKAKFFMDHANSMFEFNFGKGNKVIGRLEYSSKDKVLIFTYKDKRGKVKSIEVTGDQFVARNGYDQPMIKMVGTITAEQKKSLEDYAAEKDARMEAKRRVRLKILSDLFDESSAKLSETEKLLSKKREEFQKLNDELSALSEKISKGELTKRNNFKSTTNKAIKSANKLSRMLEDLRLEIEELEAEKEELEMNRAYVADMAQNIDELPTDSKEFLEELKEQVNLMDDLIINTGLNINNFTKIAKNVEKALKDAVDIALDLIDKFEKKYPNLPVAPDALRQFLNKDLEFKGTWPDYQSYLSANPNLMKDLMEFDRELADIDELDVIPNERSLNEINDELSNLTKSLTEAEKELKVKRQILERFQEFADKYKQEKAEEEATRKDEAFAKSILGTNDNSQQTLQSSDKYEPESKKGDREVVSSTTASSGKPHHVRANRFGANMNSFSNRENIRGVYITSKNEGKYGLAGLTAHLKGDSEADADKIIALVMIEVDPETGEEFLLDENGNRITEDSPYKELSADELNRLAQSATEGVDVAEFNINNAIYQVFPLEDLEWDDKWSKTPGKKVSMFRSSTPKETVQALKEQYKAWREGVLANPDIDPVKVAPSFGIPEYVGTTDDKGKFTRDYNAAVPVQDAGLVDDEALRISQVLIIPTVEENISKGSTSYNDPKGFVFLDTPSGYTKLENRKNTKEESTLIYQAIKRLADIIYKDRNVKSQEAKQLLDWLKSVIYWGTPMDAKGNRKPAGYNSIWFEKVTSNETGLSELRLFVSGEGANFPFTPSFIRDNKEMFVGLIQNMYNNVNSTLAKGSKTTPWNAPYNQIVSISDDGKIETIEWPNYQTYLLSKTLPDGKKRRVEDIPVTTQIRPLTTSNDVNRKGIYFTALDTAETFVIPEKKAKKGTTVIAPGAPAKGKQSTQTGSKNKAYVLDGKTPNTYVTSKGAKIMFLADKALLSKNDPKGLTILVKGDATKVVEKLVEEEGLSKKEAQDKVRSVILQQVTPQLQAAEEEDDETFTIEDDEDNIEEIIPSAPKQKVVDDDDEESFSLGDDEGELTDAEKNLFAKQAKRAPDRSALRVKLANEIDNFKEEDWNSVEKWLKTNFPNLPVYRVKNILTGTKGVQAWGMLKNSALYIYEKAEVGTVYHEVFEAVWKHFTDENERRSIHNEFKNRQGSFVDRPTGTTIKYSEATNAQIKEQLAEEFRDYVKDGKIPAKPKDGRPFIIKLFSDLVNMIKNFFIGEKGKTNTENLFKKIGTGYYATNAPFTSDLSFGKNGIIDIDEEFITDDAELRLKDMRGEQIGDIIQEMTYRTLRKFTDSNESLFNIPSVNKTELYDELKEVIQTAIAGIASTNERMAAAGQITRSKANSNIKEAARLWKSVTDQWDSIVEKHQEQLKGYSIEFDENDEAQLNSDERSKETGWHDATKVDAFKKANGAVKLLLSTIPIVQRGEDGKLEIMPSSVNGAKLLPATEVYMTIKNRVHSARNIDEMLERIRQLAKDDMNYVSLYSRLTKNNDLRSKAKIATSLSNMHDVQLLTAFWKSFKAQAPDVKNVYILDNGDVVVGDSNFSTAARQVEDDFINSVKNSVKTNDKYFTYSSEKKAYIGKPDGVKNAGGDLDKNIQFLKTLGIEFNRKEIVLGLSSREQEIFNTAVNGIITSIRGAEKIATVSGKTLGITGRLRELSQLKAKMDNPEFSSTYFNVNGERTQTFIGTNAPSDFFDVISQITNLNQLTTDYPQYAYILTDDFAAKNGNSVIINAMFDKATGKRIDKSEMLMKTAYADGTVNSATGRKKQSSKLTFKDRLVQEVNLNIEGYYLNLVPGDASIEWMTYMGNHVSQKMLRENGMKDTFNIFRGYFIDEMNVARDTDRIVDKSRNASDLRFFKDILSDSLYKKIMKDKRSPEEIYIAFEKQINDSVEKFIDEKTDTFKKSLFAYGVISDAFDENGALLDGYDVTNINFPETENVSKEELDNQLKGLTINYMIANIEQHKLIYSDPYQYADELKRIKNFNSPRQSIINSSSEMNSLLNKIWNSGYAPDDIGYTNMHDDFFRSVSLNDINGYLNIPNYESFKETDGGGVITMKAYRNFRIRSGDWNENEERQYRFDVAYEKKYFNKDLSKEEQYLLDNEKELVSKGLLDIRSAYTPIKPIVSGNKADGKEYNDVVLDKFSLYPLSFRILQQIDKESNALRLYKKMNKEKIDYAVFDSGRKVGVVKSTPLYNSNGEFNKAPFNSVTNIPFSIISVQSEVPSKEDERVTRGSQVTKLITMDFMEAGVPVDFMEGEEFNKRYDAWYKLTEDEKMKSDLYREIKHNQKILEEKIELGYKTLLKTFGIEQVAGGFKINNFEKTVATLREEMFKREVNDNISEALSGFEKGDVVLEATPAYQQVRNILYSIADKEVISPKINGAQKVQIPSTLMEKERIKSEVINGKEAFTSDVLKFYEKDGKQVCELMVGRWFKSSLSDEELLNYLNNTAEGQRILSGLAFRIPTQKQNSIESFVIKKFLPASFGDSVVVPAAIVNKAGSDFDIDKLTVYLKNVFVNKKDGKPRLIKFYNIDTNSEEALKDFYEDNLLDKYKKFKQLEKEAGVKESASNLLESIFDTTDDEDVELFNELNAKYIPSLEEFILENKGKDVFDLNKQWNRFSYKKVLENEYMESSQRLVSNEKNFDRLIKPNSAEQLKKISQEIVEKLGETKFDSTSLGNMLSRNFMTGLRNAFVTGKYAIGIAAVAQTNHSLNQRLSMHIDLNKLEDLPDEDAKWIGDGLVKFKEYNSVVVDGTRVATLSMIKNAERSKEFPEGQDISDINGQFIDGYVDISKGPWIMELGASPNVAGTWLFLTKIGVPIKTIAYFMNQPIIRDYLFSLEKAGYSWLFIDSFVDLTSQMYEDVPMHPKEFNERLARFTIPSEAKLRENVGKNIRDFNKNDKLEQQFILREFLKYAKMANQLFVVTQGSNFDTASFNDPYLVFKKMMQLKLARNTIFSSVDEFLNSSFVGKLGYTIGNIRDAFAQILRSDSDAMRNVIEPLLEPFVNLSDKDFVKIAQKTVADVFDWAVQNNKNLNKEIENVLLSDTKNAAKEISTFVNDVKKNKKHPLYNNQVIKLFSGKFSDKKNGVNNIVIKNKDNKVYDQNQLIYAFDELRNHLEGIGNSQLYKKLVKASVLQSGLSSSPISFTSLLPYQDFKEEYNSTLAKIENLSTFDLDDFLNVNVFQRVNATNDDIVPNKRAQWKKNANGKWVYNTNMMFFYNKSLDNDIKYGKIPQLLKLSDMSREAGSDFITYSWEDSKFSKKEKLKMKKAGDYSYIKKALFKKVYNNGKPLESVFVTPDGTERVSFVYKAMNVWGDGFRAKEYYTTARKSIIDNGFIKVDEVSDDKIIPYFVATGEKETKATTSTKLKGKMTFSYGANKRADVTASTTFDAILNGERTATTRYESQGNLDYWKQAKVGDIITWESEDGRTVNVEITKALHSLKNSGITAEQWSKREGWSTEYFNKNVKPKLGEAWQMEYKLVEKPSTTIEKEATPKGTMKLKNGVTYRFSAIDSDLLEDMGYTPEEIGKILKSIC